MTHSERRAAKRWLKREIRKAQRTKDFWREQDLWRELLHLRGAP